MMFSASYATAYYTDGDPLVYISRQALFGAVGVVGMFVVSKINYQTFRWMSMPALIGSIVLLVLVFTPLGVTHNQARRWLKLGIEFQPSEFAKIAVILFFAARLSKRDTEKRKRYKNRTFTGRMLNRLERVGFLELVPYGAILLLVAALMLKQPHMSGTILVLAGGASVLFAAGIHWGWFVAGITGVGGLLWIVITLTPYMTNRINLWLDPWSQRQGLGYQTVQSLIAIGSRRDAGPGAGEQHPEDAVYPGAGERFCVPHRGGGAGLCGRAGGAGPVCPADPAGVLAGPQRRVNSGPSPSWGSSPAGGAGVFEHRCGHQPDPQHGHFSPVLQLRRDRPDDPAGRDGDGAEHLPADPASQARLMEELEYKELLS